MSQEKYIGMDVHQATISVAVKATVAKPQAFRRELTSPICATFMWLGLRKGYDRRWPVSPWHGRWPRSV